MKAKDIKVGHIYFVDFEPTRKNEFGKHHMALVLKKNIDRVTFIVVPMTSSAEGLGNNKISIGVLPKISSRIKECESYAVYDQVRTVNASRFSNMLDDDGNVVNLSVSRETYSKVLSAIVNSFIGNLSNEEKEAILKEVMNTKK